MRWHRLSPELKCSRADLAEGFGSRPVGVHVTIELTRMFR